MKRTAVVLLLLLAIGAPRQTRADSIVVGSPVSGCHISDHEPRVHTLDVVHMFNPGSLSSRFKIVVDPALTLSYASESHAVPGTLGTFHDGVTICYGSCAVGDVFLGTISYQGYGTSTDCGFVRVVPHPAAETLDVVTCGDEAKAVYTLLLEVSPPGLDSCNNCTSHTDLTGYNGTPQLFGCEPLPTSMSTWGAIKALYR